MQLDYQVGIIGGGFGGVIAALNLKKAGITSFVIFEKAGEVGGVWRDNIYPGCACDVRSNLYSISTQQNPGWSANYSGQPDILEYIKNTVDKNELRKQVLFNAQISEMEFLETEGCWQITNNHADTYLVKTVILATGQLNRPSIPVFKGRETFAGSVFHSSVWDNSVDITGKKVAVIGTGASAIQIIPAIADKVSKLLVFQRSPAWVLPRWQYKYPAFFNKLYKHIPLTQKFTREAIYWAMELAGSSFMGNKRAYAVMENLALKTLSKQVKDPELIKKLTPAYKMGCKRLLVSDNYYATFNKQNVQLITDAIAGIEPTGIRTVEGELVEADIIVYATGFTVADMANNITIKGFGGRILADEWKANSAEAYLGITVAGYPNLAMILGPNAGLGHSSIIHMMESQMRYIMQYIGHQQECGYLDVKPTVQTKYNINIQQKLKTTIWATGCSSWYLDKNGKNTTIYPGLTREYRKVTKKFNPVDYNTIEKENRIAVNAF